MMEPSLLFIIIDFQSETKSSSFNSCQCVFMTSFNSASFPGNGLYPTITILSTFFLYLECDVISKIVIIYLIISYKSYICYQSISDFINGNIFCIHSVFRNYFVINNIDAIVHLTYNFNLNGFTGKFGFEN